MFDKWQYELTKNELPNVELKLLADILGIETIIYLMNELPGTTVNIPTTGLDRCRNLFIWKEYDGSKECRMKLARKFGVTERYIIRLASRYRKNVA